MNYGPLFTVDPNLLDSSLSRLSFAVMPARQEGGRVGGRRARNGGDGGIGVGHRSGKGRVEPNCRV
jgi:hypothetical protein